MGHQKKAHICLPRQCVLFSTKFALAGKWNSFAVKYLLRKCEIFADANVGKFHFTSTKAVGDGRYFTIHEVNYFTFGVRRIFHFKHYRFYDIINSSINKKLLNSTQFKFCVVQITSLILYNVVTKIKGGS